MPKQNNTNHLRPADIAAGKALKGLRENFLVVGKKNVIAWKAWLVIGIVAGIALGVMFVANRSARFETGKAWYDDFYDFAKFDEGYYSYYPDYYYEPSISSGEFSSITSQNSQDIQALAQVTPTSELGSSFSSYQPTCPVIPKDDILDKPDTNTQQQLAQFLSETEQDFTSTINLYSQGSSSQKYTLDSQIDQLAYYRKPLLTELMREDPDTALQYIINQQEYQSAQQQGISLPSNCIEQKTTIEGELRILHADFFEEGYSVDQYSVRTPQGEEIELHPAKSTEDLIISGMNIQVTGYRLDNDIVYDGAEENSVIVPDYQPYFDDSGSESDSSKPSPLSRATTRIKDSLIKEVQAGHRQDVDPDPCATAKAQPNNIHARVQCDARGAQKTVVLLVKFGSEIDPSTTRARVNDIVFTEMKNFYLENSYNKITDITGNIFPASGWYSIPAVSTCDTDTVLRNAIESSDRDVNFSQYTRLIIVAPTMPCLFGGLATAGRLNVSTGDGAVQLSISWNIAVLPSTFGHEFGHNLGVVHANFLQCWSPDRSRGLTILPSASIRDNDDCGHYEYGDRYDIMGVGGLRHMNAFLKDYFGWFDASNIQTVTADGIYSINPIEIRTSGFQVIKIPIRPIPTYSTRFLYVEYRQPLGLDTNLTDLSAYDGGLVHIMDFNQPPPFSYILDMSPGPPSDDSILINGLPPPNNRDVALGVGRSFTDYGTGNTLIVRGKTNGANGQLTVEVKFNTVDLVVTSTNASLPPVSIVKNQGIGNVHPDTFARLRIDTNNDGTWDIQSLRNRRIGPFASNTSQEIQWSHGWFRFGEGVSSGTGVISWTPIGTLPQTVERIAVSVWAHSDSTTDSNSGPLFVFDDIGNYLGTFDDNNGGCTRTGRNSIGFGGQGGCMIISNLSSDHVFESGSAYNFSTRGSPGTSNLDNCDFRYTASTRLVEFRDESPNTSCGFFVSKYGLISDSASVVGTHKFEICADASNIIRESDETNNCSSQTFTVLSPECKTLFDKIKQGFGTTCGDAQYDPVADINKDRVVDGQDFSLLRLKSTDAAWCQARLSDVTSLCP